jgi:hypothetical protein
MMRKRKVDKNLYTKVGHSFLDEGVAELWDYSNGGRGDRNS